jgi:hypothetical protein
MDIYEATKEELEKAASLWLPSVGRPGAPAGPGASKAAPAAIDEDDDMFAGDDAKPAAGNGIQGAGPGNGAAPGQPPEQQQGGKPGGQQGGVTDQQVAEYALWPVKELKRFLQVRGSAACWPGTCAASRGASSVLDA